MSLVKRSEILFGNIDEIDDVEIDDFVDQNITIFINSGDHWRFSEMAKYLGHKSDPICITIFLLTCILPLDTQYRLRRLWVVERVQIIYKMKRNCECHLSKSKGSLCREL